jgi:hypothetical protein
MPTYRNLNLRTFIAAIDPMLVEEYFSKRVPPNQFKQKYFKTMGMNYDYVKSLMANLKDEQLKGKIGEELRQMSDLGKKAMDILVNVSNAYNIPLLEEETPQQLAMRLFLRHNQAFEHAWTYYCYRISSTNLYEHYLPCESSRNWAQCDIETFKTQVRDYFVKQAKGDQCLVKEFRRENGIDLMVIHGSYIKTIARWVADEVVIDTYRPAYEDVILYDQTRFVLQIKASRKDQQQYFKSFARCILGIPEPVENEENHVYSLRPLEEKTFSWEGNTLISSIKVLEVHLKIPEKTEPLVIVKSKDVRKTFAEDFEDFDFSSGHILYVKFQFIIETDHGPEPAIFVINPPAVSDLTRVRHRDIIAAYLKGNGVLLV